MSEEPAVQEQAEKRRPMNDLFVWLAILPVVIGSLVICGQLALLVTLKEPSADTRAMVSADYKPWPYDIIPAINIAAFIQDIVNDTQAAGETRQPTAVIPGEYWKLPTPTAISVAVVTLAPPPSPTPNPTATLIPTQPPPPTTTPFPTATATRTRTPTFLPTYTFTPQPTNTRTPAPPQPPATATLTRTATSTATSTAAPTATLTRAPTNTSLPPTATIPTSTSAPQQAPTYAPVRPVSESDGASEKVDGGCRASFGYRNDNTLAVDIPLGPRNLLSDDTAVLSAEQPTHFEAGQKSGVFQATWNSGQPLIWNLDGRSAMASWCNP